MTSQTTLWMTKHRNRASLNAIRSDLARRQLRALDAALKAVQLVPYDPRQLPDLTYTRLNEHYRPAVELAKLIQRLTSFELRHGRVWASALLFDMNGSSRTSS
jgi:5-methylcytosine-specific restriction enzyme subunit McrC